MLLERAMHSNNVVTSLFFTEWLFNTKNSKCSREEDKGIGEKYLPKKRKSTGVTCCMHMC